MTNAITHFVSLPWAATDEETAALMRMDESQSAIVSTLAKRLAEAEELLSHAYKNPTWIESISLALEAEKYFNRWNNDS